MSKLGGSGGAPPASLALLAELSLGVVVDGPNGVLGLG